MLSKTLLKNNVFKDGNSVGLKVMKLVVMDKLLEDCKM